MPRQTAPDSPASMVDANSSVTRRRILAGGAGPLALGAALAVSGATGTGTAQGQESAPAATGESRRDETEPRFGRKIRVAVVGLEGHPGLVLDPTGKHPELELVAIARDTVPVEGIRRREAFRETRVYDDYREMLDREECDVVGVCNTNGHRAEVVLAAAALGRHVVAEKPIAITSEELAAIREATAGGKVGFTSLLPMRYETSLYTMGMMVREGAIGDVLMMTGQKSYKLGNRPEWFQQRELYGSTMLWIGVHQLDLMHWISGQRFTKVYSYERNLKAEGIGAMENIAGAMLHLEGGGVATLTLDYQRPDAAGSHGDDRLRVVGTKGILEYRLADGLMHLREGSSVVESPALREPALPLFLDFLRSVYLGGEMLIRRDEVFHVVDTLLAARQSDERGQMVAVPKS